MKIFGREPAAWIGLIEAVLAMVLALNMFDLTHERVSLIMAVVVAVFGIVSAYLTRDTMLGVITGGVKAVIALAAGYGFEFGVDKTAALIALTTVVVGFYQRTQTTPLEHPNFHSEPPANEPVAEGLH
jgi:hypothetical protein